MRRCHPQVSSTAEEQAKAIGQAKQLIQAGLVAYTRNGCAAEALASPQLSPVRHPV